MNSLRQFSSRIGLTDALLRIGDEIVDFWYKGFAAWLMTAACVASVYIKPLWPISYYTGVWMLGVFFPLSALLFLTFNLRIRFKEIREVAGSNRYPSVYYPGLEVSAAERKFYGYLRQRFTEYYNALELAGWSVTTGTFVFLLALFLAVQFYVIPQQTATGVTSLQRIQFQGAALRWELAAGAGFLGGIAGALVLILKKYRSFDIYPSTYAQTLVGLIAGMLAGGMVAAVFPSPSLTFIAFATSFLTTIHVDFLPRLLRGLFARLTGTELAPDIGTDLDRVIRNSEAIESLNEIGLFSIGELVKTDPIRLYLNLPHPIGVINGWLDAALLHHYCEPHVPRLGEIPIKTFTQLIGRLVAKFDPPAIQWRDDPITGDGAIDDKIALAAKSVIYSGTHHRLLGCLSPKYRSAFFVPGVSIPPPSE